MQSIPEEALEFLKRLQKNNNRDWFNEHKSEFKALEDQMKDFYAQIALGLHNTDDIQQTKAYRIYRDIRFSKDKTPYKKHFSAIFIRRKPALRGSYYVHIEPGNNSRIGAGFWKPTKEDLNRVRKEWEIDAKEIREILDNKTFKKHWGTLLGEQLKTAPMGFNREHPTIDLINYKQWIVQKKFTDEEVLSKDFSETVIAYFEELRPFFDYMSITLTTNLNGESIL